jgi:4-hydroxymandelate oxidase
VQDEPSDHARGAETLLPATLDAYEALASARLPGQVFDFVAGGAGDEATVRENRAALGRLKLLTRVLRGASERSMATSFLGAAAAAPLLIAPMAYHRLVHEEGELATARAAGRAGVPMVLSAMSTTPVEEVVAAAAGPIWFQLYVYRDRGVTRALVERAAAAGCRALVVTVDVPMLGIRLRDIVNRFCLPPELARRNMASVDVATLSRAGGGSAVEAFVGEQLDPGLTWADIEWLRAVTDLPLLVKGVMAPEDAACAARLGVDGVIVSNHGGRQLDAQPATIDVLPEVRDALDDRALLLIDGGFRTGADVVKALALGAQGVMLGRPILWALAVAGEAGVYHALDLLRADVDRVMALCGVRRLADLRPDLVRRLERLATAGG